MATHASTDSTPGSESAGSAASPALPTDTPARHAAPDRARTRKVRAVADEGTRSALADNSIAPSRRLREDPRARTDAPGDGLATASKAVARSQEAPGAPSARTAAPSRLVPEDVRERFVQVGNTYYFADGARAFTDRGRRLTTPSENTEVIRSLVAIAQARGWSEIAVRGTERFRKEAWFAARLAGIEARGYRPSEFEQGHVVRAMARAQGLTGALSSQPPGVEAEPVAEPEKPSGPEPRAKTVRGLLTGRLVDHGRATYRHDPHEAMSYFARLETPRGERVIWGVDLERAFQESLTRVQIGDDVALRAVRQDAVKVKAPQRDADGKVVGERALETHRNRWIVEKRDFFESRAEAARTLRDPSVEPKQAVTRHPELVGTYLQVHAAELAARRFRDPQDRRRFADQVRAALADGVARGEPLPPVRLRERSAERPEGRSPGTRKREQVPVRG